MLFYFRLALLWILLASPLSAALYATPLHQESAPVRVALVTEKETIQPGQPFWVALHLNLEKGWHVYWKNPGDAGLPLKLNWQLPEGFKAEPLQWPFPEKFTVDEMVGFGYHNEVTLLARLTPPSTLSSGENVSLSGDVKWLVCSELNCQPGSAPVQLNLKVDAAVPKANALAIEIFQKARSKMAKARTQIRTIHKEGIVQLQLPNKEIDQDDITGISFFPEQQNQIDSTVEPIIALEENAKKNKKYLVNLKRADEIGVKSKNLKGILVLHTKEGKEDVAIDVDSPIENDNHHEFLSFSDDKAQLSQQFPSIGNESYSSTVNANFEGGLALALLFAFIGGMILNLMPCVLPVMSLKVMSFVKMAGQKRSTTIKHGLYFSSGVVISFWILASAMLILRTYGQAVGWGFQLQEPLFVIILASILFVLALGLFDLFEWGVGVASWAGQAQSESSQKSAFLSSFLGGVMATAVATPCTGPFLGSAVGFAVTLPTIQSLSIFTFIGLGMCFPYLLLAAFPSFLRFLPKPGSWMDIFKKLMGFLLLATVLWLLWVFSAQTNSQSLIFVLAGFLCFSIGAWIYGIGSSPLVSKTKRYITYCLVAAIAVAGCELILLPRDSWYADELIADAGSGSTHARSTPWEGWETFSPEYVSELQKQGKPVLVDFTAKWCLICQANHMVLSSGEVKRKLDEAGVVKLKADWTRNDPVITEALSKFGRTSVPLYVLYSGNTEKEPLILPQVLTQDVVLEHLEKNLVLPIPKNEIADKK